MMSAPFLVRLAPLESGSLHLFPWKVVIESKSYEAFVDRLLEAQEWLGIGVDWSPALAASRCDGMTPIPLSLSRYGPFRTQSDLNLFDCSCVIPKRGLQRPRARIHGSGRLVSASFSSHAMSSGRET